MDITNVEHAKQPTTETGSFGIAGMTCDKCVARVERALRAVNGVCEVKVDRQQARATVRFEVEKTNLPALHDAVLRAGYHPSPLTQR